MRKRRSRGLRPIWDDLDSRCLLSGYTPVQVTAAYGLNAILFQSSSGATVTGDGTGQTIAIVEMYHDPNIQASLDTFDAQYHLPKTTLNVINQAGTQTDDGWGEEESLDVEWAHAIAPGAKIVVVEANPGTADQEFNNTLAAVRTASRTAGVSVVSMSWGYDEFPDEASYDSNFTTSGVTFIASSGDAGTIEWPATSANVLAIGGTSLNLSSSGGYGSESGWIYSGGGLSTALDEPAYQKAVQSMGIRSTPDVSFDADPYTGVSIYSIPSDSTTGSGQWEDVGGTSAGAPAWAGIIAIANQGRALAGLTSLTGSTQTLPDLYALAATGFNKVPPTSGGGSNMAINTAGYNTQAGLGSPIGVALVNALAGSTTTSPAPTPTPSPSPSPTPPANPLPTPRPIRLPPPIPTPAPTPPPSSGPSSAPTPLPTPTPAATPPPAAAPVPSPPSPHKIVSKRKHHARPAKPAPVRRHVAKRSRIIGQGPRHMRLDRGNTG